MQDRNTHKGISLKDESQALDKMQTELLEKRRESLGLQSNEHHNISPEHLKLMSQVLDKMMAYADINENDRKAYFRRLIERNDKKCQAHFVIICLQNPSIAAQVMQCPLLCNLLPAEEKILSPVPTLGSRFRGAFAGLFIGFIKPIIFILFLPPLLGRILINLGPLFFIAFAVIASLSIAAVPPFNLGILFLIPMGIGAAALTTFHILLLFSRQNLKENEPVDWPMIKSRFWKVTKQSLVIFPHLLVSVVMLPYRMIDTIVRGWQSGTHKLLRELLFKDEYYEAEHKISSMYFGAYSRSSFAPWSVTMIRHEQPLSSWEDLKSLIFPKRWTTVEMLREVYRNTMTDEERGIFTTTVADIAQAYAPGNSPQGAEYQSSPNLPGAGRGIHENSLKTALLSKKDRSGGDDAVSLDERKGVDVAKTSSSPSPATTPSAMYSVSPPQPQQPKPADGISPTTLDVVPGSTGQPAPSPLS